MSQRVYSKSSKMVAIPTSLSMKDDIIQPHIHVQIFDQQHSNAPSNAMHDDGRRVGSSNNGNNNNVHVSNAARPLRLPKWPMRPSRAMHKNSEI
mmetsp:Transcript_5824/g.8693  ORF Transcript_5824/g.8693 Transcript_5824/m.8693 type:complete len:94 (+) Transcript_5824:1930-2211(+)